jgi:hypothetical protein
MAFDLYVWQSPRDVDDERAAALVRQWEEAGADPAAGPFKPAPISAGFIASSRTIVRPSSSCRTRTRTRARSRSGCLVATTSRPPGSWPIRLTPETTGEAVNDVFSLAVKYDLVLFDARSGRVHFPMQEMADYADATFWPSGAIQAAVAGGFGLLIAVIAWVVGIPILSWIVILVGGFMFVMAVFTFVHEGRKALRSRGSDTHAPPG